MACHNAELHDIIPTFMVIVASSPVLYRRDRTNSQPQVLQLHKPTFQCWTNTNIQTHTDIANDNLGGAA